MAKLGLSARVLPEQKKRKSTSKKTAKPVDDVFYVKTIPPNVKMEDFNWDAPVDLDKVIRISKRKAKLNGKL